MPITGPWGMRGRMKTSRAAGLGNVTHDGVVAPDARYIPAAPPALHMAKRNGFWEGNHLCESGQRRAGPHPPLLHPTWAFFKAPNSFSTAVVCQTSSREAKREWKKSRRLPGACRERARRQLALWRGHTCARAVPPCLELHSSYVTYFGLARRIE